MKQKLIITLTLLVFSLTAGAQEATTSPAKKEEAKREVQGQIRTIKLETKEDIRTLKGDVQKEIDALRQAVKAQPKNATSSKAAREAIKEKREQSKEEAKEKREEAEKKIEALRADLKVRLQKIKDERKKQVVEKIANELNALNKRMLEHYSNVLDKLEKSLERVSERADRGESRGLNVATVRTAIADADKAIDASRVAIIAQASSTYTVEITTEEKLKADVGKARQALHADLKKVRDTVKSAHDAVRKAAVTLAQIPRIDEATSTPPTPPPATTTPPAPVPPPATSTPPPPPPATTTPTSTPTSTETTPPPPPTSTTSTATSTP